jgi:hypothetical protein
MYSNKIRAKIADNQESIILAYPNFSKKTAIKYKYYAIFV